MDTKKPIYGFTPKRHSEVDALLLRVTIDVVAILEEYRRVTP
jgi:hypothetical protein